MIMLHTPTFCGHNNNTFCTIVNHKGVHDLPEKLKAGVSMQALFYCPRLATTLTAQAIPDCSGRATVA
jgi:hypothetical protein